MGLLTIYSINWVEADVSLFIILYFAYIIIVFSISFIRLASRQESILIQAASKLDIKNHNNVYKRLKKISQMTIGQGQLSIIDKSEIIRYLAFRQVIIGEYEEAIRLIELIKVVCQIDLISCCEIYYGFYTYCKNKKQSTPNIANEVEKMFDKVTTITLSKVRLVQFYTLTEFLDG